MASNKLQFLCALDQKSGRVCCFAHEGDPVNMAPPGWFDSMEHAQATIKELCANIDALSAAPLGSPN